MKSLRILWLLLGLGLLLPSFYGCDTKDKTETQAEPMSPMAPSTWFTLQLGDKDIQVQLAIAEKERQLGLMYRTEMEPNQGMLFLFEEPHELSFWMLNTELPLSIGYFTADGTLREIYWMYPHDRTGVASRSDTLQMALEMNQGWYKQNGIKPGAKLDIDQLREAVLARGYDPMIYGL